MSVGVAVGAQRAPAILSRFPRYIEADDPGKRLGDVVAALATGIDVLTRQVQDVRTAHRVDQAPTTRDLLALAAVHGLTAARLSVLDRRVAVLAGSAGADPLDHSLLGGLLGLPVQVLTDLIAARPDDVAGALARALQHRGLMPLRRAAFLGAVTAHASGNGTATGLLTATAAYVGFTVEHLRHTPDGWWHIAACRESIRLDVPESDLTPQVDVLALEENPFRTADIQPAPKRHAQRTRVLRSGLEDIDVTVRVIGVGNRTVRPMVVHLGAGTGIVYEGNVPEGTELAFAATGRVTLDGTDVTGSAWTFTGAVFADATQALAKDDFAFTDDAGNLPPSTGKPPSGQAGRFAVTAPVTTAFDTPPGLPHGAAAVGPMRLPRGESRWTTLVRTARTGSGGGGDDGPPVPRPFAGRFDQAVFTPGSDPALGTADADAPALQLGFVWDEREPFAVRVLLPMRLSAADDDAGSLLRLPLQGLLERHRAAGVALRVEYADPRWRLGAGIVRENEDDALGVVLNGTQLWPDGTPQP